VCLEGGAAVLRAFGISVGDPQQRVTKDSNVNFEVVRLKCCLMAGILCVSVLLEYMGKWEVLDYLCLFHECFKGKITYFSCIVQTIGLHVRNYLCLV
jgi:hypothetical protein